jgi:hypothetical protein
MRKSYKLAMDSIRDWDSYLAIVASYKQTCKYIQRMSKKKEKK